MQEIILALIEKFHKTRDIVERIVIQRLGKGKQMIYINPDLFANVAKLWLHYNSDVPDVQRAGIIVRQEKMDIATELYNHARGILLNEGKKKDWDKLYGRVIDENDYMEVFDYSVRALAWLNIIEYRPYEISEPQFDEGGKLLGMKLKPKEKSLGMMKEIEKYVPPDEEDEYK